MNRREWMTGMGMAAVLQPAERVVVIGDVHGDYERFMDVLIMAGVADRQPRWTGGATQLIQIGDMLHRGPQSRRCLDVLMRLQEQAPRTGGLVEMVIGNHEVMRMIGDYRYVSAGEYAEFRTPNSPRMRDDYFERYLERLRYEGGPFGRKELTVGFRQQWEASFPLGRAEMIKAFEDRGTYGKWLRNRPVVLVAGESLIVHAGVSPKYLTWNSNRFTDRFKRDIGSFPHINLDDYLADPLGPFWWRGAALQPDAELEGHIADLIARWGVRRMVVGHTPQRGRITARFGGRVLLADVGLASLYTGARACLVIDRGRPIMLLEDKPVQLP
jgi:hypothetical protein